MRKIGILLSVMALLAVIAAGVIAESDDSADAASAFNVYSDSSSEPMKGSGSTLTAVIKNALDSQGRTVEFGTVNIVSLDGATAPEGKAWTIQQWLPPVGWKVVTLNNYQSNFVGGTSYYIHLADRSVGPSGNTVYSAPSLEPQATAYFMIKFVEDAEANDYVNGVLTPEKRRAGFWVSGTGSSLAVAFSDACSKCDFELNMSNGVKNGVVDLDYVGWLYSFLGLGDVAVGSSTGSSAQWKYWSQFYWKDSTSSWVYSETMGHYDPGVVKYFALVRQITTQDNVSTNIGVSPSSVPATLKADKCIVKFLDGNGKAVATEEVPYFGTANAPISATKSPSNGKGYTFTGWDTPMPLKQVTSNMTVTALFSEYDIPPVPVQSIKISGPDKMQTGTTAVFTANVLPADASNMRVTWSSSDVKVLTVDEVGNATALSPGRAVIRIINIEGSSDSKGVEVVKVTDRITLGEGHRILAIGETFKIAVLAGPDDIIWESSDPSVLTVSNGTVRAIAPGSVTVTASHGDIRAVCKFGVAGGDTPTRVECDASGSVSPISPEALRETTSGFRFTSDYATIDMPTEVASSLSTKGKPLTLTVGKVDAETLDATQRELVKDSMIFSFIAKLGTDSVHELGGKVIVNIPYVLKPGSSVEGIKIFYLSGDVLTEVQCTYDRAKGAVSFEIDHFSYYVLSYIEPPSAPATLDATMLVMLLAVVMIAIGAIAAIIHHRRKAV